MPGEKKIILDPRLSVIARLVGRCSTCADIGCDHGRLGAFLLQSGSCERVVLTDISEPSLKKARTLIGLLGLNDRVDFRVGDGAQALEHPVEVAVIAGMGGVTIGDILREGRENLGEARLVLQPNVAVPELRRVLCDCGYRIEDERVVQDGGRSYIVISAAPGEAHYDDKQLLVGPVLLKRMPDELLPYARFRLRVAQKALAGASSAKDARQEEPLRREMAVWEEVCACLRR